MRRWRLAIAAFPGAGLVPAFDAASLSPTAFIACSASSAWAAMSWPAMSQRSSLSVAL